LALTVVTMLQSGNIQLNTVSESTVQIPTKTDNMPFQDYLTTKKDKIKERNGRDVSTEIIEGIEHGSFTFIIGNVFPYKHKFLMRPYLLFKVTGH
jgi:hypothetical protein